MNAKDAKALVAKFIKKYGVEIHFKKMVVEKNSRGVPVKYPGGDVVKERVLLLKERYNPLASIEAPIGMSLDATRYILCLPDVPVDRDSVVTDSHGNSWRLDTPDWWDIGGEPVCKQMPVDRVEGVAVSEEQNGENEDPASGDADEQDEHEGESETQSPDPHDA